MASYRVDRILVEAALTQQAAVAIIGPRQVGKTTLARDIADQHPGSLYLDLKAREDHGLRSLRPSVTSEKLIVI